jgi:MFS family permease
VVSLVLAGHVSDWYGRRRVLVPALALSLVSTAIFLVWQDLPGLFVARIVSGLSVGVVVSTASAYLTELHAAQRPQASARVAQLAATVANVGGLALGPLVAGLLAQYVPHPLTVPYAVFLVALLLAVAAVAVSPETRRRPVPLPHYRPQRLAIPAETRGQFLAALLGALLAFAVFGLFSGLAGTFLRVTLHRTSPALTGATIFLAFGAGILMQTATTRWRIRPTLIAGVALMLGGLAVIVTTAWLSTPSLALFLCGGAIAGAGGGAVFKSTLGIVVTIAPADARAEALAGFFLSGYIGLSAPVIGLGIALQHAGPRAALLVFALVVGAGILAAVPTLLRYDHPIGTGRAAGHGSALLQPRQAVNANRGTTPGTTVPLAGE